MNILAVCGAQGALIFKLRKYLIANVEPRSVFHTKKEEQWKLNFGEIPFVRSLDELPKDISKNIDLIIGSPSCGHSSVFSYSRKKSLGKPKDDPTFNIFLKSIIDLQPGMFIMENLPKLLDLVPLEEWEKVLPNYKFITHCHPVSVFGNSQVTRKRLILIGIKNSYTKFKEVDFNIFPVRTTRTCKKLYRTIREELNFKENPDKKLSMYHYSDETKKSLMVDEVKDLWVGEFKDWYRWPMFGHKMNTLPGVYRNKWLSYPLTLRPSNRQFNHKGQIMGLEEYRVIMGFPKYYKIYFDSSNKTFWLNKARVAYTKGSVFEVGLWVWKILRNKVPK